MLLKEVIDALLFASQKPLLVKDFLAAFRSALDDCDDEATRALASVKEPEVLAALRILQADYQHTGRGFELVEGVSGWTVVTKATHAIWVRQLYPESKPTRLSGPSLETLAIVAYRQPITKADIEAVRGVAVDGVLQSLLDRGLIRIAGRSELPGRPLLYETTQVFMEHFGLRSLGELPNGDELRRVPLPKASDGDGTKGGRKSAEKDSRQLKLSLDNDSKAQQEAAAQSEPEPPVEDTAGEIPPEVPALEPEHSGDDKTEPVRPPHAE